MDKLIEKINKKIKKLEIKRKKLKEKYDNKILNMKFKKHCAQDEIDLEERKENGSQRNV